MGELKTLGNRKVRGGKGILHRYDRQRGEREGRGGTRKQRREAEG